MYIILITIIAGILRFILLDKYPVHLNHDEITQLYDAISIAQTGKDIYGNFMPTIFESVHDFKPPFYTYITSLIYLIFGWREVTIRIAGAFFGTLIVPAIYLFVKGLLQNKNIALVAAAVTIVAPFEVFFSRKSFESGAGIFFMLIGFYFLLSSFKKINFAYFAAVSFAAAMYTYFSHVFMIPLMIGAFVVVYKDYFSKYLKKYVSPLIVLFILLIPLAMVVILNPDSRYRSRTVYITQDVQLGNLIKNSQFDSPLSWIFEQGLVLQYIVNRYLSQFDLTYIFNTGLDLTNQGLLGMGPLFLIQLPFLILGVVTLVKGQTHLKEKRFILLWVLLGILPSAITFEPYSPHRSIIFFTMLNIISALGIYNFYKRFKWGVIGITVLGVWFVNLAYFFQVYTVNFPSEKSELIQYPFEQVALFAWSKRDQYDQVVFDPTFGEVSPVIGTAAHYYLAYYGNYPPAKFQKEYRLGSKEREVLFDKFSIRKITWLEDQHLKRTLLIGSGWVLPVKDIDKGKVIKTFKYFDKNDAFYAINLE